MQALSGFWADEDGQDLIEYTLLVAFVALSCITLMGSFQPFFDSVWRRNTDNLRAANAVLGG
jgi:Flp pilus assembly pilin Flp